MPIDEEDKEFWFETIKNVKTFKKDTLFLVEKDNRIEDNNDTYLVNKQTKDFFCSKFLDDEEVGGIDNSTLSRFKKELFKIEKILDLHGKTEEEAFVEVNEFILNCYNSGKRCVIIITGKGLTVHKSADCLLEKGVLKKRVPQWLNMPSLRSKILVFKHPSEKLGGCGALYILLKRNRDI